MDKITYKETLSIWWAFFWKSLVFGILIGGLVGVILGFVVVMLSLDISYLMPYAGLLGYIISLPLSFYVLKKTLGKKYKTFSLEIKRNGDQ